MDAQELLQAIQSLGEQPKIVVSVEVKRSVGQWESVTGQCFLTFHLPAGSTNDDVLAEYARLYAQAHAIAEAEAEASVQRHAELARQRNEQALTEAATAREASERQPVNVLPSPERLEAARATLPTPGGRQLTRAPKAADRQVGDWWYEVPTKYRLGSTQQANPQTGERETVYTLSFFREGLTGAVGTLLSWQEAWPDTGWLDAHLTTPGGESVWTECADGQVRDIIGSVRITNRVSNKTANTGNYRVDVIAVQ